MARPGTDVRLYVLDGCYRGAASGVFSKMLRKTQYVCSMFIASPDLPLVGRLGGIENNRVWDPFILLGCGHASDGILAG